MTRRDLLRAGAALSVSAALGGRLRRVRAAEERPNLLLLMADQFRGDCIGADGNAAIHTPNLDRLAREGALFHRAYSSTPTCTPARACLLTGLSPWRHGMLGYGRVAEKYPAEFPQVLRDAGYYTLGIGKMHWNPQRAMHGFHRTILDESGRTQSPDFISDYRAWFASQAPALNPDATNVGWNDYQSRAYQLPEELHPTRWTGDVAVRFLDTYERPEPFFMKVSFARPHSPYDPPPRWFDHYADADLPAARVGNWAEKYRERSDESSSIWHGDLGPDQVRTSRQGYYGSVSFVDEQVGRILEALERRGQLDRTLVLFTADHGDMTGDHHLWRKSYAYEASARIPMLLRWPRGLVSATPGQVLNQPVELRDVMPTFLDAAGAVAPVTLDGSSLLDLARGQTAGWRPWIDLEHDICYDKSNHWSAITDGRMKYIYHAMDGAEQLFDLDADPGEEHDLAGETAHTESLAAWRKRMAAHLEERGPAWVKDGRLVPRPQSILYSPHYPQTIP
jgi:arylsulfatase A-like enzyme